MLISCKGKVTYRKFIMSLKIKKIWDRVWEGDSYSCHKLRQQKAQKKTEIICKEIDVCSDYVCVDLGCGAGYVSHEISIKTDCTMIGIDFSDVAIKIANEKFALGNKCSFMVGTANKIPLADNCVDVVFCIGVLEHVPEIEGALREIKRILKPGGYVVIFTSNCYSLMYVDRLLKQKLGIWRYGYQKNWSSVKLSDVISSIGIIPTKIKTFQGFGDFPIKNAIDTLISCLWKSWGRYFLIIGRG